MKELSIVYKNADYPIQYEYKDNTRFSRVDRTKTGLIQYVVFFEDIGLKDQFGNPFVFYTDQNFNTGFDKKSAIWEMVEVIIKAINKEAITITLH